MLTTTVRDRWLYSMSAWYSSGGISRPWHFGQSGQPSPERVARTSPPTPIRANVAAVVATTSLRNRLTSGNREEFRLPRQALLMSVPNALKPIKDPVDRALLWFLSEQRVAVGARDPDAAVLIDELERVVRSGGKRLRPAFCYWGYRAAGGIPGEPIVRVAAALELFHTFALIHDDVMDEAETR